MNRGCATVRMPRCLMCVERVHDWGSGAAHLRSQAVRLGTVEFGRLAAGAAVVPLGSGCGWVRARATRTKFDEAGKCLWVVMQVGLHVWSGV